MILNKNSFCQVADEKKHARPFAGAARYQTASRQLFYYRFRLNDCPLAARRPLRLLTKSGQHLRRLRQLDHRP